MHAGMPVLPGDRGPLRGRGINGSSHARTLSVTAGRTIMACMWIGISSNRIIMSRSSVRGAAAPSSPRLWLTASPASLSLSLARHMHVGSTVLLPALGPGVMDTACARASASASDCTHDSDADVGSPESAFWPWMPVPRPPCRLTAPAACGPEDEDGDEGGFTAEERGERGSGCTAPVHACRRQPAARGMVGHLMHGCS